MRPEKKRIVNGHKVEQYYWAREYPVYVDNHLVETGESFDEVCKRLAEPHPTEGQERKEGE
jgi:hypothetical protein